MLVGGRGGSVLLVAWFFVATLGVLLMVVGMAMMIMMAVVLMNFMRPFMLMLQLHSGQRSNPIDENHAGSQHGLEESP